ncbi:MAG: glycosyltransferase family 9 protein [Gammaproteobacteria bacterium]
MPLLSLPRVHGTTLSTIPAHVPYLDVRAIRREKAKNAVNLSFSPQRKVGIAWSGSPTHDNDRRRSCPLSNWQPVLQTPNISFYSLQKDGQQRGLPERPDGASLQDLDPLLNDYGDLALLIEQLDLVISVDTSVAHVAGALGKPVWTLLSYVPDWRWLLVGESTPWYPTMRLFRQAQPDDWAGVMSQVAAELKSAI